MKPSNQSFECSICGEALSVSLLSRQSVRRAGTDSKLQAIMVLDAGECTCQECESAMEVDDYRDGSSHGRTEVERFEFSGVYVDPAKLQAYRLSH